MKIATLFSIAGKYWVLALVYVGILWIPACSYAEDVYRLNTGDKLRIDVWQEENLRADVIVLPDGTINFPLVGSVPVAGKTTTELASVLKEKLSDFIPGPEVNVALVTLEGNVIYVIGEVTRPGPLIMTRNMTVVQALSMAGGLTPFAEKNDIHILRADQGRNTVSIPFRYGDVEDGDKLDSIVPLQSGDTIIVP
ncbi:polysaccharide biosynthesis/export family protein [Methylococcus sp. EFPC2]|nr:polysaccharide biosynthesis/export family protein [Methylococcus sp. EFPC2]